MSSWMGCPGRSSRLVGGVLVGVLTVALGGCQAAAPQGGRAGDAASVPASSSLDPPQVTLEVNMTITGYSCDELGDSGFADMDPGSSVTLVTGSENDPQVLAAASWQQVDSGEDSCDTSAQFRVAEPDLPSTVGLDTSGSRGIFWADVADFPLYLGLDDE